MKHILVIAFILLFLLACGETTPTPSTPAADFPTPEHTVPKGERQLGIDITQPEKDDFETAFSLARDTGMGFVSLPLYWDDIETAPGTFQPDPNWLAIANLFYGAENMPVALEVNPIDTVTRRTPADLANTAWDDPALIARYQALLDYAFSQLPDVTLVSLTIGNEIDGYLSGTDQWQAYETFFAAAADYARQKYPGLKVGVKIMFDGLTGENAPLAEALNRHSDVVMTTYYPLNPDFTVRAPSVVHTDFATLVEHYPQKPIYVLEAGYPTSEKNRSSEALQAQFIHELFAAWDAHAAQIPVIELVWLTDLPESAVRDFTGYYGVSAPVFAEYLRPLGLRTYPGHGADKLGFAALRAETTARGW